MAKSTGRWSIGRLLGTAVLLALIAVMLLGFYWLITFPDVAALKTANPHSTALMDARSARAKAAGEPSVRRWNWVPLSRMSPHLQRAVIAAEDAQFFSHEGFDWEGVREAAIKNLEAGKVVHGGSMARIEVERFLERFAGGGQLSRV